MSALPRIGAVAGRALLAQLFMLAGVAKVIGPQPFLDHMRQFGVPTLLLPAVIVLEVGAGALVLVGWRTMWAAGALAGFSLLAAAIFHHDLGDKAERTLFFKDIAIAGGLLTLASAARRQPEARP